MKYLKSIGIVVLVVSLVWWTFPKRVQAAITLYNSASGTGTLVAAGTEVDVGTVDAGTDSNRAMFVVLKWVGGSAHTISAVTFNGDGFTSLAADSDDTQIWELANPDSGSNTLIIDPSTGTSDRQFVWHAYIFTGVDQTDISDGYLVTTGSDASNPIQSTRIDIVSETGDLVLVAHGYRSSFAAPGPSSASGFTEVLDTQDTTDATGTDVAINSGTAAGAADVDTTVTWQNGAIGNFAAIGLNINAAAEAGGGDVVPVQTDIIWFES